MKKRICTFIVFCLIVPFCLLLGGCNEPVLDDLQITLANNEGASIEREFGDVEGLDQFVVTAFFTNGEQQDVSEDCQLIVTSPNEEELTFAQYQNKISSGALEAGYWTISVLYEGFNASFAVHILKPKNENSYTLEVVSLLNGEEDLKNCITYGTKYDGVQLVVTSNDSVIDASYVSNLYILNDNVQYTAELKPSFDIVTMCNTLEDLLPDTYYACVLVSDDVYADKFTEFVQITVKKSKIEIDSSSLELHWSFNVNTPYENVTYNQMMLSQSSIEFVGGQMVMYSDHNDNNNDEWYSYNKKTKEEISSYFSAYGDFICLEEEKTFNASSNLQQVQIKFVPNEQYSSILSESDAFVANINIQRCTLNIPIIKSSCCDSQHFYLPNTKHSLLIYNQYKDLCSVKTNGLINTSSEDNFLEYYTYDSINMYVEFELLFGDNYAWKYAINNNSNYSVTYSDNNSIIKFGLNVTAGDIESYGINIKQVNRDELQFDSEGKINLMLCNLQDGQTYLDGTYTWEVLPAGSIVDGTIALASGTIDNYAEHTDDTKFKTLTLTDVLSQANDYSYVTIAIKISANTSSNWNSFEKTFILTISK